MDVLFGKPPKMVREVGQISVHPLHPPGSSASHEGAGASINDGSVKTPSPLVGEGWGGGMPLADAVARVLRFPAVADKSFLITIGDRTVTGLVCRDQMIGPWQVPVSDVAVTATSFDVYTGEAMAMGERTPLALLDAPGFGTNGGRRGADQHRCRPH